MAKHFQVDTGGTLTTNLVAYYKLEDANDYWSSYNLTNNGSTPFNAAKVNNGADFGANNTTKYLADLVTYGNLLGGSYSFALWLKIETEIASGEYDFISLSNGSSNHNYTDIMYQYNGGTRQLYFVRALGGITDVHITYTVTLGTTNWNHIVATYDGSYLRLYLNGSLVAGPTAASGNGNVTFSDGLGVGARRDGFEPVSGIIDEFGIWSKALSTTEISDLYNSGSGQTMVDVTNYTRSVSDSLMNAASRTATIGRVAGFSRSFSDSLMNAASRLATLGKGTFRNISDSIMNAASRYSVIGFSIGRIRALADSMMNAASRLANLAQRRSFYRSQSDSVMNGASRTTSLSSVRQLIRNLSDFMMNAAQRFVTFLITVPLFQRIIKSANTSFTNQTKSSATFTNQSKSSNTSFTNVTKSSDEGQITSV